MIVDRIPAQHEADAKRLIDRTTGHPHLRRLALCAGKPVIDDYALAHGPRVPQGRFPARCPVIHPLDNWPMKSLRSLAPAFALVSLVTTAGFAAHAGDLPLSSEASSERFATQVLAVDPATHQVTIEGLDKRPVLIQLTDKAKALRNLKVGDKVEIRVTRSIDYVLDNKVGGEPTVSNDAWINRAPPDSLPGGEAYRTVKITSKITGIDAKKHQVNLLSPDGKDYVVTITDPKVQAHIKDFQVGQTVDAIHTEVLKVETSR